MPATARPRVVAGLRLLRQVGEGGEGEVWEARDPTGRRRALKLIRPDALVAPEEVEQRGRWLLAIDHPALVAVHRCGVLAGGGLDGWGFVEMAFVDGPTLGDAAPDPDALDRLEPLAEALDLLHAGHWSEGLPLVHRDVKPANLVEQPDGELVLVDASTLRDVDDGMRTRIGTPLYAAPEVVTGRAGPLADVYSFAATAVALWTGARGSDLAALLAEPEHLDLPEGLRAALAPDPSARPVSCRAALDPSLPLIVGAEVGWAPAGSGREDGADPDGAGARADIGAPETSLPSATEVLLDPWHDPFEVGAATGGGRVAPWTALLVAIALAPLLGGALPASPDPPVVAAGALGVSILACLIAGRGLLASVLLPPHAWAGLLAERLAAAAHIRAWAQAALLPGAVALMAPAAARAVDAPPLGPGAGGVLAALGVAAILAALAGARSGRAVRLVLAPLWLLGAGALLVGGVLLLPLAALVRRGRDVAAALREVSRGAGAFLRR